MSHLASELTVARHCALLALLIICAYTDVARSRIYNAVTYTAIFVGFALSILQQPDFARFGPFYHSLIGAGLGAGVFLLVYVRGAVQLGDVKFMAAVGALAPNWEFALRALVLATVVGFVIALAVLIWSGRLIDGLRTSLRMFFSLRKVKAPVVADEEPATATASPALLTMPYGVAIAVGTMWAWVATYAGSLWS